MTSFNSKEFFIPGTIVEIFSLARENNTAIWARLKSSLPICNFSLPELAASSSPVKKSKFYMCIFAANCHPIKK